MWDEIKPDFIDATDNENAAIASVEEFKTARGNEIQALSTPVESKFTNVGEFGVKVAEQINSLDGTNEGSG